MAFASVAARNASVTATASTNHTAALPAGISAGDLLILSVAATVLSGSTPSTVGTPSGWTAMDSDGAGRVSTANFRLRAVGDEGSTVAFTTSLSAQTSHVTLRITGDSTDDIPEFATQGGEGTDTPTVTPAGGAQDYLWLWLYSGGRASDGTLTVDAAPTNYLDLQQDQTARSLAASAERELNASSETVGSPTLSADVQGRFATLVAVYPGAGAPSEEADFAGAVEASTAFGAVKTVPVAFSSGVSVDAAWTAQAAAQGALAAAMAAGSAFSAQAAALASIVAAIEAGDTDTAAQSIPVALAAVFESDAQFQALADAAAALAAGVEAGEAWAAQAAASAILTADASVGDAFEGQTGVTVGALQAGTLAAAQFLGAVAALAQLQAGMSASAAFSTSGGLAETWSEAIEADDSLVGVVVKTASIAASVAVAEAFGAAVDAAASLSAGVTAASAFASTASALGLISAGVTLGSTFSAASSADISIVDAVASVREIQGMSASVQEILGMTATLN
jgi:hypothetical protein